MTDLRTIKISTPYATQSHNILAGTQVVAVAHYWARKGESPAHWKVNHKGHHFDRATLGAAVMAVALQRAA